LCLQRVITGGIAIFPEKEQENRMRIRVKLGWAAIMVASGLFLLTVALQSSRAMAEPLSRTREVIEVSEEDFEEHVLKAGVPVVVSFHAPWCGPCRQQAPILDELARELDNARIVTVNVDENIELGAGYEITAIPTLLIFAEGEPVARRVGLGSKEDLRTLLNEAVAAQ
jgi:thioredoxin 1